MSKADEDRAAPSSVKEKARPLHGSNGKSALETGSPHCQFQALKLKKTKKILKKVFI